MLDGFVCAFVYYSRARDYVNVQHRFAYIPLLASGLLVGRKLKRASSAVGAAALGEYLRNQTLGSQQNVREAMQP